METLNLKKMELDEIEAGELSKLNAGKNILYYLAYDAGFLLGASLKTAGKIAESLLSRQATSLIR